MRTYWLGIARGLSSLAILLLSAACGGGGGGGGGGGPAPVVYGGNTGAATVSPTSASKLTANVVGSNDTATIILGVSIESGDATQDVGSGAMDLALRLNRTLRDTVVRAEQARSSQRAVTAALVSGVCQSGSISTTGTLDSDGTGTVTVSFNNCLLDGITLNGSATLSVDVFDPGLLEPTDFTISFSRLTLRGSGLSIDAGGSLRVQLAFATNKETITANFVSLDNNTGEMTKTDKLEVVNVYDSISFPTSFTANISGRVFDQVHGYVDVMTTAPLLFGTLSQLFPDSGQLLLTGAGNSSIRGTALSATLVKLELDLDGNGVQENTATLKWTDLSGPAGSDLDDTDVDGMHNSWETVNGLDKLVDDAAGDKDGDLVSNINEYLAGTDP